MTHDGFLTITNERVELAASSNSSLQAQILQILLFEVFEVFEVFELFELAAPRGLQARGCKLT